MNINYARALSMLLRALQLQDESLFVWLRACLYGNIILLTTELSVSLQPCPDLRVSAQPRPALFKF